MSSKDITERTRLLEEIVPLFGALHRCFAAMRDEMIGTNSLSQSQLELLMAVKHRPHTISELAEHFSVTPSAVSQTTAQLEEAGLVERTADTADRRITYIKIAPKAQKQFRKIRDKLVAGIDESLADITTDELKTLSTTLTRINKTLETENIWKK